MSQDQFKKYINPKKNNAAIKEKFKQEKKAAKKQRAAAIDQRFEEKRALKRQQSADYRKPDERRTPGDKSTTNFKRPTDDRKPFGERKPSADYKKPAERKPFSEDRKPETNFTRPAGNKMEFRDKKPFESPRPVRNFKKTDDRKPTTFNRESQGEKKSSGDFQRPFEKKFSTRETSPQKTFDKNSDRKFNKPPEEKKSAGIKKNDRPERVSKPKYNTEVPQFTDNKPRINNKTVLPRPQHPNAKLKPAAKVETPEMPLNKYLAHCGVTSRRDAVQIIKEGKVKINGTVVLEPSFKVNDKDEVIFNGKKLFVTKNLVYILLNKPKDYITTTDDPQGRKTVLELLRHATTERIYPVGRLDRNTSGVLLFTNDGEFTQKMTHPSYEVKKVYEAKLDKPLTKAHFDQIIKGLKLEDGNIHADALAYADAKDKSIIGIEIHSGRNRIVRRIFEHLGYDVKALDRVMYANLTKKNVERGKWRFLSEKEIRQLKYINKATARDTAHNEISEPE